MMRPFYSLIAVGVAVLGMTALQLIGAASGLPPPAPASIAEPDENTARVTAREIRLRGFYCPRARIILQQPLGAYGLTYRVWCGDSVNAYRKLDYWIAPDVQRVTRWKDRPE